VGGRRHASVRGRHARYTYAQQGRTIESDSDGKAVEGKKSDGARSRAPSGKSDGKKTKQTDEKTRKTQKTDASATPRPIFRTASQTPCTALTPRCAAPSRSASLSVVPRLRILAESCVTPAHCKEVAELPRQQHNTRAEFERRFHTFRGEILTIPPRSINPNSPHRSGGGGGGSAGCLVASLLFVDIAGLKNPAGLAHYT
jgi:hypothetical protein